MTEVDKRRVLDAVSVLVVLPAATELQSLAFLTR